MEYTGQTRIPTNLSAVLPLKKRTSRDECANEDESVSGRKKVCQRSFSSEVEGRQLPMHHLRPAPFFYYVDHSREEDDDPLTPLTPMARVPNFPAKMHAILARADLCDVVAWMSHGRSWKILCPREFEVRVLPTYFEHSKFSSFIRQANGWGFRRITKGPDKNSYYNELFLRGLPHLCKKMRRPAVSEKIAVSVKHEPNFYEISERYPVPEKAVGDDDSVLLQFTVFDGPKARMPVHGGLVPSKEMFSRANRSRKDSKADVNHKDMCRARCATGKEEKASKTTSPKSDSARSGVSMASSIKKSLVDMELHNNATGQVGELRFLNEHHNRQQAHEQLTLYNSYLQQQQQQGQKQKLEHLEPSMNLVGHSAPTAPSFVSVNEAKGSRNGGLVGVDGRSFSVARNLSVPSNGVPCIMEFNSGISEWSVGNSFQSSLPSRIIPNAGENNGIPANNGLSVVAIAAELAKRQQFWGTDMNCFL